MSFLGSTPLDTIRSVRRRISAVLLATALSPSGCVSFKAVETTGELGSGLTRHVDSIAYVETACASIYASTTPQDGEVASLGLDAHPACASIGQDARAWSDVIASLAKYGKLLEKIAGDDALDVSAQLEDVRSGLAAVDVEGLGDDRAKDAVGAAGALVKLISAEIRRKTLRDTILDADPQVQKISSALDAHLEQQLRVLASMQDNLLTPALDAIELPEDLVRCTLPSGESMRCEAPILRKGMTGALFALNGWILERTLELKRLRKAVAAFAKAHAVLERNASALGREDAKHVAEIIDAVAAIYEGLPREEKNGEGDDKQSK